MALEPFAGILVSRTRSKVAVLKEFLQVLIRRAKPLPKRANLPQGFIAQSIFPHSVDDMNLAAADVLHALAENFIEVQGDLPRRVFDAHHPVLYANFSN